MSTTPAKMYSKQDVRNNAVFSEFLIFECSCFTLGGLYHGCSLTVMYVTAWTAMQTIISPISGINTFRETRFAVGRFWAKVGAGPAQPMRMAIGKMSNRSMNKNWKSPRFDAFA